MHVGSKQNKTLFFIVTLHISFVTALNLKKQKICEDKVITITMYEAHL